MIGLKSYIRHSKFEIWASIALIIFGLLFIFVPTEVFIYILAIFIALVGFGMVLSVVSKTKRFQSQHPKWMTVSQGVLFLATAAVMILFPIYAIRVIGGIIFILVPFIKLLNAKDKKTYFLKDIYKYIIGLIIVLIPKASLELLLFVIGIGLVALGVLILVLSYKSYKQGKEHSMFYNMAYKKIIVMTKGEGDDEFWNY